MKLAALALAFSAAFALGTSARANFSPKVIDYKDIELGREAAAFAESGAEDTLMDELCHVGLVAVRGIPGYANAREHALSSLPGCALQVGSSARSSTFPDGTKRTTLASATTLKGGMLPFQMTEAQKASPECRAFFKSSKQLRDIVSKASDAFALRLDQVWQSQERRIESASGEKYGSIKEFLAAGDKLEHFHVYEKKASRSENGETVEMHTDQGMFIAFSRPLVIRDREPSSIRAGELSIKLMDGTAEKVAFDGLDDALFFMLGDGVNEYLNPAFEGAALRATPHTLSIPLSQGESITRAFYGRMFLPPQDAVNRNKGLTAGELRRLVGDATSGNDANLALGCSGGMYARELSESACPNNTMFCWHRCMDFPSDANPEICKAKGFGFNCTDMFDQIYRPQDGHGDYSPKCTNSEQFVTPQPTIAPQLGDDCDDFEEFSGAANYDHRVQLSAKAVLSWSVVDGDTVKGTLAYEGRVGYIAFGIANPGGKHFGMNGAHILMGLNYGSGKLSADEYIIDNYASAFRHWSHPVVGNATTLEMNVSQGCYSSITFETKAIAGWPLKLGHHDNNKILWAVYKDNFNMGHHGRTARAVLDVNFHHPMVECQTLMTKRGPAICCGEEHCAPEPTEPPTPAIVQGACQHGGYYPLFCSLEEAKMASPKSMAHAVHMQSPNRTYFMPMGQPMFHGAYAGEGDECSCEVKKRRIGLVLGLGLGAGCLLLFAAAIEILVKNEKGGKNESKKSKIAELSSATV